MKNIFKLLSLVLLLSTASAQAGVLVEPIIGLNFNHKLEGNGEDFKGLGGAWGGRLGYQNYGFQLGLDYLSSSTDMDEKELKNNFKSQDWAAFIGFEFPILVRVYAGYIFSSNGEVGLKSGGKAKLEGGSGTKIGIGFTGLPFVDINVEYRRGTYDDVKLGGTKGKDMDFSATMISLSLPLNL